MQFYRLVKPLWAQPTLANGEKNPKFVEELPGPNVIEGAGFTDEFLAEKNRAGYNVYFFPNHPSKDVYAEGTKHLSGKNIDVFSFVFVDMDLKDGVYASKEAFLEKLSEFPYKPTMVVDSGNGIHAYWRVSDLTRSTYVVTQLALINHFKTDASIWTVLQLMRVPTYMNTKRHGDYVQCVVLESHSSGETYSIKSFDPQLYDTLDQKALTKAQNHINRLDGKLEIDLGQDINVDELPDEFYDLMLRNSEITRLFRDPKSFGDRSSADMKLANILFTEKFDIRQAVAIISNTQKALEKGSSRRDYATLTVSKVYGDRPKHKFQTVGEWLKDQQGRVLEPQIFGPWYLDYEVLGNPWRRKEILGLVAGSGIGKTAMALNILRDILENNPTTEDVYVFFSLEMSKGQIINRWLQLVGENSPLADRLYVVDNQDEDGMPLIIGLQEIYEYCTEIQQVTGKHVGAFLLDHFHLLSSHIDIRKTPNFGVTSEQGTGRGDRQNLSPNMLATQLKALVKTLDTFGIILAQTTKDKGVGDLPIGKDGAYAISQFEWIMNYIVTIWQPLMRVQNLCKTNFLAYQFAKIREKHTGDKIKEYEQKLLTYEMGSGRLRPTTSEEYVEFQELLPKAQEIREALSKKKVSSYSLHVDVKSIDAAMEKLRAGQ